MVVVIAEDGTATLEDPDDFSRFHVAIAGGKQTADVLRRQGLGWAKNEFQAFVAVDALVRLHPEGDGTWLASLEAMAVSARSNGWWDGPSQSVAAHIERRI